MAFSCPVIAVSGDPNSGPETEAVIAGQTGLSFVNGDVQDLVDKIETLLAKPELGIELAVNAFALVEQRYTAERHAGAMIDAIVRAARSR